MNKFGIIIKEATSDYGYRKLIYLFVEGKVTDSIVEKINDEIYDEGHDIAVEFIYDKNTDLSYVNSIIDNWTDEDFNKVVQKLKENGYEEDNGLKDRLNNCYFRVDAYGGYEEGFMSLEITIPGIDGDEYGDMWQYAIPYKEMIEISSYIHLEDEGYIIEEDIGYKVYTQLKDKDNIKVVEHKD